jgi:uncharacterized membrane protein YjgN (DUF898 family)
VFESGASVIFNLLTASLLWFHLALISSSMKQLYPTSLYAFTYCKIIFLVFPYLVRASEILRSISHSHESHFFNFVKKLWQSVSISILLLSMISSCSSAW